MIKPVNGVCGRNRIENTDVTSFEDSVFSGPYARGAKRKIETEVEKSRGVRDLDMLSESIAKCAKIVSDDVASQAEVLCKIKQLLGTSGPRKSSFRSWEEKESMPFVRRLSVDPLIVLPTGRGKYITIMLPASLYRLRANSFNLW